MTRLAYIGNQEKETLKWKKRPVIRRIVLKAFYTSPCDRRKEATKFVYWQAIKQCIYCTLL